MRDAFQADLKRLHTYMIEMGTMCEGLIAGAQKALTEGDRAAAERIMNSGHTIDQKEKDIEALCLKLLVRQAPVASDLRHISVALKIITDMERIGDQAEDIAEIVLTGDIPAALVRKTRLTDMARQATEMVSESVKAYVREDAQLAGRVIESDDTMDDLFDEVRMHVMTMLVDNPDHTPLIDLIMIAKYYERIGDHATNIAEWVVFEVTGHHDRTEAGV